ncbi:MAG: DUF4340 domain-containing protein [Treponema sp.]|nr:DUF4340 domain-containing protein [Treponema sp.]
MKKNDVFLISSLAFLIVTFILSFFKEEFTISHREYIKSALINQKYIPDINSIEFSGEDGSLLLTKTNSLWLLSAADNPQISFPADAAKVENFLNDFSKVRNMYKISDKITAGNSFGLTDSTAFVIKYHYKDTFDEVIFGNQDFSLSSRYMMSGRNTAVYEVNDEIQKYLSSSVQFWAEPYLISRYASGISSADSVQRLLLSEPESTSASSSARVIPFDSRLLELRHGGLALEVPDSSLLPSLTLTLELGNKSSVIMNFYSLGEENENSYLLVQDYLSSSRKNRFYVKISSWTYRRIKEITL